MATRILSGSLARRCRYIHVGDSHTQGSGEHRTSVIGTRDLTHTVAMASGGVLLPLGNGGTGGQTSPMVAARIKRALKLKPDVIGVTVGTNDALVLSSADYVAASLTAIKRAVVDAGARMFVTTVPPTNVSASQALVASINAAITAWATANNVRLVDVFSQCVAGDGVSWLTNYNQDDNHWTSKTGFLISQYIWGQIEDLVPAQSLYTAPNIDASNLLFAAIANTGLSSSSTVKDPLFRNHRSFNQNSFTIDMPYLFATQYGSGTNPTSSSSTYSDVDGVAGKVWAHTMAPNGAGGYTAESGSSNRMDVTDFQGRRLRIGFLLGMDGFSDDNTDAYLAANSDVPLSGFGISFSFYDADGTIISTSHFADPIDTTGTVNGASGSPAASAIPLDIQGLFGRQGSSGARWMIDHDLLPVQTEINVPAGAVGLGLTYNINFAAGASSPVTVSMAEMSFVDVGPLSMPEVPTPLPYVGTKRLTAAYTVTGADAQAIGVWRCDATSAAFSVTLPPVLTAAGRTLTFRKIDAGGNAVTLDGYGSETIDGATTQALSSQWDTLRLYSNGKTWDLV